MRKPPVQKPGRSKQDYETPRSLLTAIRMRFKATIDWDLAASKHNRISELYFGLDHEIPKFRDALSIPWHVTVGGLCFLNPPFGNIGPWAKKCYEESLLGVRIMFLTPASPGSRWFERYVHGKAYVMWLTPRLSFDGLHPFPKDCCLAYYHAGVQGSEVWRWDASKSLQNGSGRARASRMTKSPSKGLAETPVSV